MIVTWARGIRDHKWLTVRAILVGWAALFGLWIVTGRLVYLDEWLFVTGVADVRSFWPGHERFWGIVTLDFIFMRLPIVAVGIWGVRDLRREPAGEHRQS